MIEFGHPASVESSAESAGGGWELRLYVAGHSVKSVTAIAHLKKICDGYLAGKYQLEIIDLIKNPARARMDQIVAIPTLVCRFHGSTRKVIGDLSNSQQVLSVLGLVSGIRTT